MKVVYDISVLGAYLSKKNSRTGVYRVIEETLFQLICQKDIDVRLTASDSSKAQNATIRYLSALKHNDLQFIRCYRDQNNLRHTLANKVNVLRQRYKDEKKFRLLCQREIVRFSYKLLPKVGDRITIENIRNCDIFHGPTIKFQEDIFRLPDIKKFVTVYDLISIKHPEYYKGLKQGTLLDHYYKLNFDNYVCCISEATKNDLLDVNRKLDPEKVFVTHLAASNKFQVDKNPERFQKIRDKYNITTDRYFLSLCTLEPRKNLPTVIRNFIDMIKSEKLNDVSLVLVGSKGWDFEGIFTEISKAESLKGRVICTGFVDDDDLSSIYSNAIAFLYMSYYEGFGLPPLEAMQCGTPVITSNTSSLPEVVGNAGLMMAPTDHDGIKQAMLRVYHDSELRAELSKKSLKKARSFSWETYRQQLIRAYKSAHDNCRIEHVVTSCNH